MKSVTSLPNLFAGRSDVADVADAPQSCCADEARPRLCLSHDRQEELEGKARTLIRRRLDLQRASHCFEQRAADGEPKPRARKPDPNRARAEAVEEHRQNT